MHFECQIIFATLKNLFTWCYHIFRLACLYLSYSKRITYYSDIFFAFNDGYSLNMYYYFWRLKNSLAILHCNYCIFFWSAIHICNFAKNRLKCTFLLWPCHITWLALLFSLLHNLTDLFFCYLTPQMTFHFKNMYKISISKAKNWKW